MILIADECLNKDITKTLTSKDYEIISISEVDLGISDKDVLIKSKSLNGILLTEDSDFGKWVFLHHFKRLFKFVILTEKFIFLSQARHFFEA